MQLFFTFQKFWNKKSNFEKIFWQIFFTFIIVVFFCLLHFEKWEKYFFTLQDTKPLSTKNIESEKFIPSSEIIQTLKNFSKSFEKIQFFIKDDIVVVDGFEKFENVMDFLYQIESFSQNFILDFYLYHKQNEKIDFKIIFVLRENF